MKKWLNAIYLSLVLSLVFIMPMPANAADDVYYDLGEGFRLYIAAEVCKVPGCITSSDDTVWKDYSTTSVNVAGDGGSGETLVVAPGDVLTFRGGTSLVGVNISADPIYGVSFTNESYLTIDNAFGSIVDGVNYADVDADGILFQLASYENISLSGSLVGEAEPVGQFGAITAVVKDDVPDGTVITGTFYLVDEGIDRLVAQQHEAQAADNFLRSTVRILVSNPEETTEDVEETPALPVTGNDTDANWPYYLIALLPVALVLGAGYAAKRAQR